MRILRQHTAGVAVPTGRRNATCTISAAIRQLVIERGHLGITNRLLQPAAQCTTDQAASVLAALTRRGEIHSAKVAGLPKHWFASAELAQRWASSSRPAPDAQPRYRQRMAGTDRMREPTAAQNLTIATRGPAGGAHQGPARHHRHARHRAGWPAGAARPQSHT